VPVIGDNEELSKALLENDPKVFLLAVMSDKDTDPRLRMDAAKALMPFMHIKLGEGGKKTAKEDAAKKVGQGKFAAAVAPLKLVGSR
jgi:phage terminase small subunit